MYGQQRPKIQGVGWGYLTGEVLGSGSDRVEQSGMHMGGNTHEQFGTQIKSQSGKEPEGMEIRREIRISLINIRSNCGGRGEAEL